MASHDFESFLRRQLIELRDRLVAEYRRVERTCPPSSSWTQPITSAETSWTPRISELEDADQVISVPASAVNGASNVGGFTFVAPAPPAHYPQPEHSPNAAGLPELFDTEVDFSEVPELFSGKDEENSKSTIVETRQIAKSPVRLMTDSHGKEDDEEHSVSDISAGSEEFVNHEENPTQRMSQLDDAIGTGLRASSEKIDNKKLTINHAKHRSVRMSAMVSTENIGVRPIVKPSSDGETRLWNLQEVTEGDAADEDSDEPKRRGPNFLDARKSQMKERRSAAFDVSANKMRGSVSVRNRGSESEKLERRRRDDSETQANGWIGTPRGSQSHIFTVLPVWTNSGIAAMRKRAFSMRTKSLFLEVDIEKTKEETAAQVEAWWMLHPSSTKHLMWDMFGLMLLAYDCVLIPLEVYEMEDNAFSLAMAWIIRWYWTASIFKSFITGYLKNDGAVEMRFGSVARRYLLTWFTLDLIVVLVDWAEAAAAGFGGGGFQRLGSGLRGLRMVRTVRLIRLIKAPEITSFINEQIRSEQILLVATIAKVIIIMLGVAHVLACAWFGIGRWSSSDNRSWINQHGVHHLEKGQQYVSSFHWSLSQFAGELTAEPTNGAERVFTVCVLFFAIMVSAWFVSSITTSMTQLQIITSQQSTQTAVLRRYLVDQNISRPLALRVQRNAQHALREQKKNANESSVDLLKLISNPLLVELHFEIHGHVLFHHPFFLHYNIINPGGMRKVCHTAVSVLSLHPGDVLFRDLEVPTHRRMFFVINGGLVYKCGGSTTYVEKGDWMCEAILWTTWTHCGTVKAYTETQLLVLEAEKFQDTISTFPSDHPAQYAEEFIKRLNQAGRFLTDIALEEYELKAMINEAFPRDEESSSESEEGGSGSDDDTMNQQLSSTEDGDRPPPTTKRSSVTSTKSGRGARRGSRMSTSQRASQMLTKGLSTLLGSSDKTVTLSPSRSGSRVSNRADDKSSLQNEAAKARKLSTKKKSRSGSDKEKSSSFFKSMKQTRISVWSHMSHGLKAVSTRSSLDNNERREAVGDSDVHTTAWFGIGALWKHKKEVHDVPPAMEVHDVPPAMEVHDVPPAIQQVEVNGKKSSEDDLVNNAWSSLGHMQDKSDVRRSNDSEMSIDELQDMQVVPMGRPGSGLSFHRDAK